MPGQQDSTNQYAKQNLQQIYKNVIYFAITNWLGIQIEGWHKDKSNFCMVFSNSSDNFIQGLKCSLNFCILVQTRPYS